MADRLKSLNRMAAVQKQIVRLSEWRLATAERACHDLAADQARLQSYVLEEGALGVALAKSALKSLHRVDLRLRDAERARDTSRAALDRSKQREHAVDDLNDSVARATRRTQDDRALAATIETWLAAKDTSLP